MSYKKKIIIFLASLIFLTLIVKYYTLKLEDIDSFFYKIIISIKQPIVTNFFKLFTFLGGIIGTILLILIIFLTNRKKGLYFLINILGILIINIILKNIFMRERPIGINMITEKGYSFPSGHSAVAISAYGLLIYYIYHSNLKNIVKKLIITLFSLIIITIPISRVYLGVHYFSDIIAGICISLIWLMFYTEYLNKKKIFKQ